MYFTALIADSNNFQLNHLVNVKVFSFKASISRRDKNAREYNIILNINSLNISSLKYSLPDSFFSSNEEKVQIKHDFQLLAL